MTNKHCHKDRRTSGSASVEFAVIAPVLIMAVLSTADIGFAIHESFKIDQTLRNGAQVALSDPGESAVCTILSSVDPNGGQCFTDWVVDRYHVCPESPDERMKTPTTCANNRPTAIIYEITGNRAYSGILLPSRDLVRSASVQVR
jgi:pilus assembly protein CpaE